MAGTLKGKGAGHLAVSGTGILFLVSPTFYKKLGKFFFDIDYKIPVSLSGWGIFNGSGLLNFPKKDGRNGTKELNIQIFGLKKCQDTRKAQRYFKERAISYQFVDLTVRGLSKGELDRVKAAVGLENLMDTDGKEYARRNLKYLVHDREELLLACPLLLKTPIVRNGPKATVGYCPDIWQGWS